MTLLGSGGSARNVASSQATLVTLRHYKWFQRYNSATLLILSVCQSSSPLPVFRRIIPPVAELIGCLSEESSDSSARSSP